MSLSGDFSMYYSGTVVRTPGGLPFIIQGIERNGGPREELSSLRIIGDIILDSRGRRERGEFDHDDVIFELPVLGWRMIGGVPRWLTYRPYKTVKKGIHPVRLFGFKDRDFNRENIFQLFQADFPGRISDDWCEVGTELRYKGLIFGSVNPNGNLELLYTAQYMQPRLAALVGDRVITILPEE